MFGRVLLATFLVGCGLQDPLLFSDGSGIFAGNFGGGRMTPSGFLIGTTNMKGVSQVLVRYDAGVWRTASGTTQWKVALPNMQADGVQWRPGTSHTVEVVAYSASGRLMGHGTWSILQGLNQDVNGDGYSDVAVGAAGYNLGQGRVYVLHSQGTGGIPTQDVATAQTTLTGAANSSFGSSVTVGDVNGDGYADVVVGAHLFGGWQGRVYVFHSQGTAGVATQAVATANTVLTGGAGNDEFGRSVATGDMNGDGYADIVAGANSYNAGTGQGRVYVFHSSGNTGVATQGVATANTVLTGGGATDYFGWSVATGDINGDGYSDVVAGAIWFGADQGRVYVFHSQGAGGVATQGVATANTILTGSAGNEFFGARIAVGDVNGDSFADVIASAPTYSAGGNQGRVYVFHSQGATGIATQGVATANTILTGSGGGDRLGDSLAVGDVNGDGYADVVAGAKAYNAGANQGRVYIFHSQGTGGVVSQGAASANTLLTGGLAGDQFGYSVAVGDSNGDSYADVIAGAWAYEAGAYQGRVYVFHSQGAGGLATQGVATGNTVLTGGAAGDTLGGSVAGGM